MEEGGSGDTRWSDLDPDLLLVVFGRLSFVQQLAFRGVCRAWRSAALSAVPDPNRPLWLIRSKRKWEAGLQGKPDFDLVDQSSGRVYRMKFPELEDSVLLMARHGWLLAAEEREYDYRRQQKTFRPYFFNPFSRTTIKLPTFIIPFEWCADVDQLWFDFSAPPTSRHCIVFVLRLYSFMDRTMDSPLFPGQRLSTWTCKPTMSRWREPHHHLTVDPIWLNDLTMVQLPDGKYVCGDESGQLVGEVLSFNPLTNQFNPLSCCYPALGTKILCHKLDTVAANGVIFPTHEQRCCPYLEESLVDHNVQQFGRPYTLSPFRWVDGEQIVIGPLADQTLGFGYSKSFIRSAWVRPWWAEADPGFVWLSDFLAAKELAELQAPPPCGLCEAISVFIKTLQDKISYAILRFCGYRH